MASINSGGKFGCTHQWQNVEGEIQQLAKDGSLYTGSKRLRSFIDNHCAVSRLLLSFDITAKKMAETKLTGCFDNLEKNNKELPICPCSFNNMILKHRCEQSII
jgi:hypothetical protein